MEEIDLIDALTEAREAAALALDDVWKLKKRLSAVMRANRKDDEWRDYARQQEREIASLKKETRDLRDRVQLREQLIVAMLVDAGKADFPHYHLITEWNEDKSQGRTLCGRLMEGSLPVTGSRCSKCVSLTVEKALTERPFYLD